MGYRDGVGIAGKGNSLSRIYFLNSIPSKQVCRIWLHPRDQKCSVLCWWPLSGRQHRQEALQGPPSGPAGWLQHSWHRIHWRPKGEGGRCQEFWSQARHVAWHPVHCLNQLFNNTENQKMCEFNALYMASMPFFHGHCTRCESPLHTEDNN